MYEPLTAETRVAGRKASRSFGCGEPTGLTAFVDSSKNELKYHGTVRCLAVGDGNGIGLGDRHGANRNRDRGTFGRIGNRLCGFVVASAIATAMTFGVSPAVALANEPGTADQITQTQMTDQDDTDTLDETLKNGTIVFAGQNADGTEGDKNGEAEPRSLDDNEKDTKNDNTAVEEINGANSENASSKSGAENAGLGTGTEGNTDEGDRKSVV